jgi:excinuclease ABC subunit B
MREAAADLEFETAAKLRDELRRLEAMDLGLSSGPAAGGSIGISTGQIGRGRPGGGGRDGAPSTKARAGARDGRGRPSGGSAAGNARPTDDGGLDVGGVQFGGTRTRKPGTGRAGRRGR